jgi:hypothetical protein
VKSASVQQKVSGSANLVAVAFAAQTQNTRVSGNGVLATCLLSEASALVLVKAIVVSLAVEEENV